MKRALVFALAVALPLAACPQTIEDRSDPAAEPDAGASPTDASEPEDGGLEADDAGTGDPDSGPGGSDQDAGPGVECAIDSECPQPGRCDQSGICRCSAGYHRCGEACLANDDPNACGNACVQCSAPEGAAAACVDGVCKAVCATPQMACGDTCCRAIAVSVGSEHSCVLTSAGGVKCWGESILIGDGTYQRSLVPVAVAGLQSGVRALEAGTTHTCALLESGGVKCWGYNVSGSLGNDSTAPAPAPVQVVGLTEGVSAIEVGANFTCALVGDALKCWGNDAQEQLGNGQGDAQRHVPADVSGLAFGVSLVSAGWAYSCAALQTGGAMCWGWGASGQLGTGSTNNTEPVPAPVSGLSGTLTSLQTSMLTAYAIATDGTLYCWGGNGSGQCATGGWTISRTPRPVAIPGLQRLITGPASQHACGIFDSGALKCWGGNAHGEIGDGTVESRNQPTQVYGLEAGVVSVATGERHTCAVTADGWVSCWGDNTSGQLGDGTTNPRLQPGIVDLTLP